MARSTWTLTCAAAGVMALGNAAVAQEAVPEAMLGLWARDGQCESADALLVITTGTAVLGTARAAPIVYYADDAGPGQGAIHWAEEGNVDNFAYDDEQGAITYNAQGYNMPGRERYERCG